MKMKLRTRMIIYAFYCWVFTEVFSEAVSVDEDAFEDNQRLAKVAIRKTFKGANQAAFELNNGLRAIVQTNINLCKTFVGQRGEENIVNGKEMRVIKLMTESLEEVDLPPPLGPTLLQIIAAARNSTVKARRGVIVKGSFSNSSAASSSGSSASNQNEELEQYGSDGSYLKKASSAGSTASNSAASSAALNCSYLQIGGNIPSDLSICGGPPEGSSPSKGPPPKGSPTPTAPAKAAPTTQKPVVPDTPKPTSAPVTTKPTTAPTTPKPTPAPVTTKPTTAPTTPKPTQAPVTKPPVTPAPAKPTPTTPASTTTKPPPPPKPVALITTSKPTPQPPTPAAVSAPTPKFTDPQVVSGDKGVKFLIQTTVQESGTLTFEITIKETTKASNSFYREDVSYKIIEKQKKPAHTYYYTLILQKKMTKEDQDEMKSIIYLESLMGQYYDAVHGNIDGYDFDTLVTVVWTKDVKNYRITNIILRSIKDVSSLCGDTSDYIKYRKQVKGSKNNETTASFVQDGSPNYQKLFSSSVRFTMKTWYESYQQTLKGTQEKFNIQETISDTLEGRVQFIKITWQVTKVIDSYTSIAILYPKGGGEPRITVREFRYGSQFVPYGFSVSKIVQQTQNSSSTEFQELRTIETVEVRSEMSENQLMFEDTFKSDKWYLNFNFTILTGSLDINYSVGRSIQPKKLKGNIMN